MASRASNRGAFAGKLAFGCAGAAHDGSQWTGVIRVLVRL
jgi:hypothetical protein